MNFGRGGNQGIHRSDRVTRPLASRHYGSPGFCNGDINRQHPTLKAQRQIVAQPVIEPPSTPTWRQAFNPVAEFTERDDADENAISSTSANHAITPGSGRGFTHSDTTLVSRRKLTTPALVDDLSCARS